MADDKLTESISCGADEIYVDQDNTAIKAINKAGPDDIKYYYHIKTKSMKLYLLYKQNKEMFPTLNCCDKCYMITKSFETYFFNKEDKDFIICEMCYEDSEKNKHLYELYVPGIHPGYGFCHNIKKI